MARKLSEAMKRALQEAEWGRGAFVDDDGTVIRTYRALERRGFVSSQPSDDFTGMTLFTLTDAGRAAVTGGDDGR